MLVFIFSIKQHLTWNQNIYIYIYRYDLESRRDLEKLGVNAKMLEQRMEIPHLSQTSWLVDASCVHEG